MYSKMRVTTHESELRNARSAVSWQTTGHSVFWLLKYVKRISTAEMTLPFGATSFFYFSVPVSSVLSLWIINLSTVNDCFFRSLIFFSSGRKSLLKSCSENSDSVILTSRGACYGKWNISSKTSCGERKAFIEPVAHCPTFPLASQPNREPCLSPAFIVELLDTFNLISTTPYS